VIAGGGGAVVLESLEHALARGATILAEVVGFGATSDGEDMVAPRATAPLPACARPWKGWTAPIDYINTHGTSTPVGDVPEAARHARSVWRQGAAVLVHQVAHRPLAGRHGRARGHLLPDHAATRASSPARPTSKRSDPAAEGMPWCAQTRDAQLNTVLSNSFGFGGTNASLVLRRWEP
jgi:3-oxoacyl-[acyl-carrier-protein] synthase-1